MQAGWRGRPIEAPGLRLRPLVREDAPAVQELAGDWEVARTTARIPHPLDPAAAEVAVESLLDGMARGTEIILALERRIDGRFVGCASAAFLEARTEIGYWIGRPFWGRGHATEAVQALTRLLFTEFETPAITVEVMADNKASARVLEKAAFSFEGDAVGECGRCSGVATRRYRLRRDHWRARWAARPTLLVSAAALIDVDGRVLMARRPEGKPLAGLWEFPGGKVRDGETPEAALVRELHEELTIDVTESCVTPLAFASHAYDDFHLLMPVYACRTWKGTLHPREGQALKWLRPARLADLPMPPADIPLVALIRDFLG